MTYNNQHSLSVARADAAAKPSNQYAWFNLGTSYVLLKQYREAAKAFDQASRVGQGLPFRMLWYQFTPYEAYYNAGNYTNVMALVDATLQTTQYVEETFYWRGMVEAAQGKSQQAIADFKQALKFNPNFTPAAEQLALVQNGSFIPPLQAAGK
jgi:tetratricopeptide (TPR) repeat protein